MKDFDLSAYLNKTREVVDSSMKQWFYSLDRESRLVQAMEYAVMAGGKRVRPVLCLAAAEAVGGTREDALDAACALEMIHTFSLVHDDLPAMDDDDLRRGVPTCHKAFDEATAVLAGDALLSLALEILTDPERNTCMDPSRRFRAVHVISRSVGAHGMIEGQMRDMLGESREMTLAQLEDMHKLKTGAILRSSVLSGAILGGANESQLTSLDDYAVNIGLAFQVADDVLNVVGDPKLMGKAAGTDEARNKTTYPRLLGLEKAREFAAELTSRALQALEAFDNRSDPLRAIARYIVERKR